MNTYKALTITAATSITLGIAGLAPLAYFRMQQSQALANAPTVSVPLVAPQPVKPAVISGKPVKLVIASLSMNLDVVDGAYNQEKGTWTLSNDKVHYALPTVQPNNDSGNTLIYGHYRPEVFARLHTIQPGAQAIIDTDNGHRFTYTFQKSETVAPDNTDVFTYEGTPRLTIQTCTGAFMQNRQLYYFDFTSVKAL